MSQIKAKVDVVDGSNVIVFKNIDLRARVKTGDLFMLTLDYTPYAVTGVVNWDGLHSTLYLTVPYNARTRFNADAIVQTDFTEPDALPLMSQGDLGTARTYSDAITKIQAAIIKLRNGDLSSGLFTGMVDRNFLDHGSAFLELASLTATDYPEQVDRGIRYKYLSDDGMMVKEGFFGFDNTLNRFKFVEDGEYDEIDGTFTGQLGTIEAQRFVGLFDGAAGSAAKLTTPRTVSFTGDVVGSFSFDGSANVSTSLTIQPNSIALGTDTTGNYVAGAAAAANSKITVTAAAENATLTIGTNNSSTGGTANLVARGSSGEFTTAWIELTDTNGLRLNNATQNTMTFANVGKGLPALNTISIGTKLLLADTKSATKAPYSMGLSTNSMWWSIEEATSAFSYEWFAGASKVLSVDGTGAMNVTGNLLVGNTLTVTGNLVVQGEVTTVNTSSVTVEDPIISLGSGGVIDGKDRGIQFTYNTGSDTTGFFGFDVSTNSFKFIPVATVTGEVVSGTLGNIEATNFIGALTGNASTASKWLTARTITLGGDLTGSVSIDGTANATLTATIAANSVILGTDTTGNYAASVAVSGGGLTITGAAGEGTAFTVNSNATASNVINTLMLRDGSGNFAAGAASLTSVSSTGDVTSATQVSAPKANIGTSSVQSNRLTIGTTPTAVFTFDKTVFNGGKIILNAKASDRSQTSELLVTTFNLTADTTEYAIIDTNGKFVSYSASVSGNIVTITATSTIASTQLSVCAMLV